MLVELNDLEKDDLKRLGDAYVKVMEEFKSDDTRTLHAPHGVFAFVHTFFHEVFSGVLEEQAREAAATIAAAAEGTVDEDDDAEVVINMEPAIMKAFEAMVMVGIEVGRVQLGPEKCRCIENVGDSVEAALWGGECGQG